MAIECEDVVVVIDDPPLAVTVIAEQGQPGPAGAPGSGGDLNYLHTQLAPATTWTVAHNLGKYPSVSVIDSGGNWVIGEVFYVDLNNLTITFSSAFSGRAALN